MHPRLKSILKGVAIWLPTVVFGALFVMQGLTKLAPGSPWPEMFGRWGYPDGFHLLVGIVELSCGVGLFVPRIAGWAHMSSFRGIDLSTQPEIMRHVTEKLRKDYDYRYHREGVPLENPNTQMIDGDFADWFGVGGPPAYVVDRLAELVELGIGYFGTVLVGPERERFAAEVMPAVRAAATE